MMEKKANIYVAGGIGGRFLYRLSFIALNVLFPFR